MALSAGTRLGIHEILGLLGSGGMGEVYRARDTQLEREVAIKVLPEIFARDPVPLARFRREAQLLASLNHPNIAAIYGLTESDGVHYLVLELVPGETLRERVARAGPACARHLSRRQEHRLRCSSEPRPGGSGGLSGDSN